jgi:hypothetical protein
MELAAGGGANNVNINSNELHFVIGIVPPLACISLHTIVSKPQALEADRPR